MGNTDFLGEGRDEHLEDKGEGLQLQGVDLELVKGDFELVAGLLELLFTLIDLEDDFHRFLVIVGGLGLVLGALIVGVGV